MLIGGAWVESDSGARFTAESPATGETIGTVPEGTRADARKAIAAANEAWHAWGAASAFDRAATLERVAELVVERRETLARTLTLDQGKPLVAEAYDEVDELAGYFRQAAADGTRLEGSLPPSVDASKRVLVYRAPRGVVGVITPWNWPYTMPAEVIAPALAAGNAVVWAAAPSTSVCAVALAECVADAGVPAGRAQPRHRPGAGRRRRDRLEPGHARGRVHRLHRDRAPGGRARGREGAPPRDGRERAIRRARGRGGRSRGGGRASRRLPLRRPELHGGRALPRARARARRVPRGALCRDRSRDPAR